MPIDARDGKRRKVSGNHFLTLFCLCMLYSKTEEVMAWVWILSRKSEKFWTTDLTALREISKAANEYHAYGGKICEKAGLRSEKFIYGTADCTYSCLAESGREDYQYREAVSGFTADDLQPDPACTSV